MRVVAMGSSGGQRSNFHRTVKPGARNFSSVVWAPDTVSLGDYGLSTSLIEQGAAQHAGENLPMLGFGAAAMFCRSLLEGPALATHRYLARSNSPCLSDLRRDPLHAMAGSPDSCGLDLHMYSASDRSSEIDQRIERKA